MKPETLKELRLKMGLTQKDLADILGFRPQFIAAMENRRRAITPYAEKSIMTVNYIFNNCDFKHFLENQNKNVEEGKRWMKPK